MNAETTVAEAASSSPRAVRVFDLLAIDYCCRPEMTLREAASRARLDVDEVLDLVLMRRGIEDGAVPLADPGNAPLRELTGYTVDHHHRRTRRLLVDLGEIAAQVASAHAASHPVYRRMREAIDHLSRDLVPHMAKEEQFVFRYIDSMQQSVDETIMIPLSGTVDYPLRAIRHDHAQDLQTMTEIRNALPELERVASCDRSRTLVRLLRTLDEDLQAHVRLENDILFPRAIEMEQKLAHQNRS